MSGSVFDPDLLGRCISCGFCLPACPTYAITGRETSSPRGRINLMRALDTGELPPDDATLREEASFCLGCRACEPVCPAGVQYGQLLEQWRGQMWSGLSRPLLARLLTTAASMTWAHRIAGRIRRAARSTDRIRRATPGTGWIRRAARRTETTGAEPALLMLGCFERSLYPAVSRAARSLAPELRVPGKQGCCGALHAHNGDPERGAELGKRLGEVMPGVIVTTSGGCAAHLADTLGHDRVRELSTYLGGRATGRILVDGRPARVALQDSCHLRNGLGIWQEPRAAVAAVAELVELPDAARCCGAAGTYSMLRRADSRTVLGPKLDQIEAAGVDYVVAVNPGCLRQLQQGLRRRRSSVRAVHLAQLLTLAAATEPEPTRGATA